MRGITRNQGIQTEPGAYGLLAGLTVLLLAAAALACGDGCAHPSKLDYPSALERRYDAAVEVTATCDDMSGWYGSGVIVSKDRVLTAGHVLEGPPGVHCVFVVEDSAGKLYLMHPVALLDSDHVDLGVLELSSPVAKFEMPAPEYGPPPQLGEWVCTVTAHPRREHKCGQVFKSKKQPGDIRMGIVVEPGNSGSALYDARGRLVGIVVHLYQCDNGQFCSGAATSLAGHMKELGL
jgi:S1-C subfamily serine protease